MAKLAEFWVMGHLVLLYPEGFAVFRGSEAEWTFYETPALVAVVDTLLLLLWRRIRPATSPAIIFPAAMALGAAGMLATLSNASLLSSVAVFLGAVGAVLGIPAFGLSAVLWPVVRGALPQPETREQQHAEREETSGNEHNAEHLAGGDSAWVAGVGCSGRGGRGTRR